MGSSASEHRDPACLDEQAIAAFVEGSLDGEPLLRAEAHIAECESCRGILGDAAYGVSPSSRSVAASAAGLPGLDELTGALPTTGQILADKYRIEETLGKGGMGAVYAARHLELGHKVAIKVLFRAEGDGAARFLREAQTCARLTGENVVRVFDVGRLPSLAPYLVMEHLTGKDLGRVVREGPVAVADAVTYVLQACAGLVEAHAVGVVHRDLKPANLFLTARADGTPLVKVLDFGVSKLLRRGDAREGGGELSITTTQAFVGSPLFMSPEQIRDSKDVDERADIWSLGVILYQLLTRRLPFPARTLPALLLAIGTDTPAPPSRVRRGVPAGLDACVRRCLEKDRDLRYPNLRALMADLAPFAAASSSALAVSAEMSAPAAASATSPLASTGTSVSDARSQVVREPRRLRVVWLAVALAGLGIGAASAVLVVERRAATPAPTATATAAPTPSPTPSPTPTPSPSPIPSPIPTSIPTAMPSFTPRPRGARPPGAALPAGSAPRPAGSRFPGPTDTPD